MKKPVKKYTIIYTERVKFGGHFWTNVQFDLVRSSNITKLINTGKYENNVTFVFDGWVTQSAD